MHGVDEDIDVLLGRGTDLHCCRRLPGVPAPRPAVPRHSAASRRVQVKRITARPARVLRWTDGKALVVAGVAFAPVELDGTTHVIGQANNALLYPGPGLGAVVARASRITDGMLQAAAEAVAGLADLSGPGAPLLPRVENLRASSARVAVSVARRAAEEGGWRAPGSTTSSSRCTTPCGSRSTPDGAAVRTGRCRRGVRRLRAPAGNGVLSAILGAVGRMPVTGRPARFSQPAHASRSPACGGAGEARPGYAAWVSSARPNSSA
ncbi:malic enzyme-like NAD(P)-binding protein [Streptomyces sp. NPDC001492]